jgi:tRNA nucleotidyltransferase/poly(A) polymerase
LQQQLEDYVRSLGLDAYLVGGAVRDELLGIES